MVAHNTATAYNEMIARIDGIAKGIGDGTYL
jgi:hypothetical protein